MTKITYKEQQKNNVLKIEDIDIEDKEIELLLRMLRQETKEVADNIDIPDYKEAKINCRTIKDIADKINILLEDALQLRREDIEIKTCCYKCGKKRYNTKVADGITMRIGICPFCNEKKMLIPASDWEGFGD